jgi:hypothetical protein
VLLLLLLWLCCISSADQCFTVPSWSPTKQLCGRNSSPTPKSLLPPPLPPLPLPPPLPLLLG